MTETDPGMAIKMAPPGLSELAQLLAGEAIDERPIADLIEFVDARHDCSDFRMITLLTVWSRAREALSPGMRAELRRAILEFPYWLDEPGTDAMCTWSENHQVIFGACEFVAGQAFPDEIFGNSGFTGRDRMARARARLDQWLADRFRFGYTEWSSTTYYEEHAAGLGLLTEHVPEFRGRAAMALDLLFLDLALHGFGGRLVTTSGRAYEEQKKYPETADVDQLLAWAFPATRAQLPADSWPDHSRISGPLLLGEHYRVPEAIVAIASEVPDEPVLVKTSTGIDTGEVASHYPHPLRIEDAGLQLWAMEAFTTPQAINLTAEAMQRWGMQRNAFLYAMAPFIKLRRTGILPFLVWALHPATRGVAIQRANITTWRTRHGLLSSTQQYHPGHFGDQQHLWSLALPGDVAIFANHPGAPMFENNQRGFSPAEWVGNGINPALGQDENVLLACYDTRGRPGLLEHRPRRRQSHLFVQLDRLDQRRLDEDRLWVRAGDGCAQILTDGRMLVLPRDRHYQTLGNELMRNGRITAWAVVLGTEPCTDLDEFRSKNQGWQLRRRGGRLELTNEATATTWRLDRRRFTRNGEPLPVQHPRFDTPWVKAERFPTSIEINAGGHQLILDATGRRSES